jgi:hypothetical protein
LLYLSISAQNLKALDNTPEESSFPRNQSQSSLLHDNSFWETEINLTELKLLFKNIYELIQGSYTELSVLLIKSTQVIDRLLPFRQNDFVDGKLIYNILERKSVNSMNSLQKENYMIHINELIGYINCLFKPSNSYIIYSYRFRKMFRIHSLFENTRSSQKEKEMMSSFVGSQKSDTNSNKSILENLLN